MAAQPILSDINHEIHTVIVDGSGTDFVVHLPTTLDNVIQAQLISAVFTSSDTTQTAIASYNRYNKKGNEDLVEIKVKKITMGIIEQLIYH